MLFCGINISKIFISRMVATLGRICTKKKKKKKMESKKKKKKKELYLKKKITFHSWRKTFPFGVH